MLSRGKYDSLLLNKLLLSLFRFPVHSYTYKVLGEFVAITSKNCWIKMFTVEQANIFFLRGGGGEIGNIWLGFWKNIPQKENGMVRKQYVSNNYLLKKMWDSNSLSLRRKKFCRPSVQLIC